MRGRHFVVALALAVGAYGCRLILGIGDAEDARQADGGGDALSSEASSSSSGDANSNPDGGPSFLPACAEWCWENPLPQGNELVAVWANSATDIWAVGRNGATVHGDGTKFDVLTNRRIDFRRLYAPNATEAFGLGEANGNVVLRYDGGTWGDSLTSANPGQRQLFDVWGIGGDIWVVGGSSTPPQPMPLAMRLQAGSTEWVTTSLPFDAGGGPPMLQSIRGTGPNQIWAAAGGNQLAHWTGSWEFVSCESQGLPTPCFSQAGFIAEGPGASNALWLVSNSPGGGLTFSRFNGSSWMEVKANVPFNGSLASAAATKSGDVWILGQTVPPKASRFRGTGFDLVDVPLPGNDQYNGIAAYGDSEVLAVGSHGAIARVEGNEWKAWPNTYGVYPTLTDVCASGGTAIAVGIDMMGQSAVVVRKRDNGFTETSFGTVTGGAQSCWLPSADEEWLLAHNIYKSDGKEAKQVYAAPNGVMLRRIRGEATSKTIWAVGVDTGDAGATQRGFAVRFDGTTFVEDSPSDVKDLTAVWIDPSTHDAWAVGTGSVVLHHDAQGWHRIDPSPSPVTELASIAGSSATDIWIAGSNLVAHWDGKQWESHPPSVAGGGTTTWSSIAVHGSDVWVVAPFVAPQQWDGHTWSTRLGAANLIALTFDRDGALWAAGAEGAIQRHGP